MKAKIRCYQMNYIRGLKEEILFPSQIICISFLDPVLHEVSLILFTLWTLFLRVQKKKKRVKDEEKKSYHKYKVQEKCLLSATCLPKVLIDKTKKIEEEFCEFS